MVKRKQWLLKSTPGIRSSYTFDQNIVSFHVPDGSLVLLASMDVSLVAF